MLEGAKNYLVSVVERTIGIRAYRESMSGSIGKDNYQERFAGQILGSFQLGVPAFTRALIYYINPDNINAGDSDFSKPHDLKSELKSFMDFALGFNHTWGSLAGDVYLAYLAAQVSHNPAEFVALKLAANAATHVGLDIVGGVANKLKTFRPTATALAV